MYSYYLTFLAIWVANGMLDAKPVPISRSVLADCARQVLQALPRSGVRCARCLALPRVSQATGAHGAGEGLALQIFAQKVARVA